MYGLQSDMDVALITFYLQGRGQGSHGHYNKQLAKQLGSVVSAIMLEEIITRSFPEADNDGWFAWSHNEIKKELCISHTTVDRIVAELRTFGVETQTVTLSGQERRQYRVHFGLFMRSLTAGNSELKTAMSKRHTPITEPAKTVDNSTGVCQNDIPLPPLADGGEGDYRGSGGDTENATNNTSSSVPITQSLALFDDKLFNDHSLDVDALVGGGSGGNPARAPGARGREKPAEDGGVTAGSGAMLFIGAFAAFMNGATVTPSKGHCIQLNKLRLTNGDELYTSMLKIFFSQSPPWPAREDGWSAECFIKHSAKWIAESIRPKSRSVVQQIQDEADSIDPAFDAILKEAERKSRFNKDV